MNAIYFDMDGTLNQLYNVPNWLERLRSYDASPYAEAKVNLNMSLLARYLNQLQRKGFKICVISWLSAQSTPDYDRAVTAIKYSWLDEHLGSVSFDEVHITDYGVPKESFRTEKGDILFDDNETIRKAWEENAYPPDMILSVLHDLLTGE